MSIKKNYFVLATLNFLFWGTYFIYLTVPIYFGYYPIGIAQLILLLIALFFLVLHTKDFIFIAYKKIKLSSILLLIAYIPSILFMVYAVFVWYAFMP
ncbi:hypothetical protein SAMN04488700_0359 [Carnobacterium iners]|uniref:Uncharacterized protein n=1 Tax=Carnobacterium iners TaxID=1073423 RepID=A0A1X7MRL7_9LACT|nr:hypothetical protein [Carnobacterium iners]SEL04476.1 hypothetical protein SAMN04488114_1224 [Carnobacterium iners]SMH26971.1 hypothetical protein SAMN04488700_0359 [Carnobacterium iners]